MLVPMLPLKCVVQAFFIFSVVIPLSRKSTNSIGPTRLYFWVFPWISALRRCTVNSSVSLFCSLLFFNFVRFGQHRFSFIFSWNLFRVSSLPDAILTWTELQVMWPFLLKACKRSCKALWSMAALGGPLSLNVYFWFDVFIYLLKIKNTQMNFKNFLWRFMKFAY